MNQRVTRANVDNSDPKNIYYNLTYYNSSTVPVVANYNETRTSSLLTNPADYYLSVVRFSIPGNLIPINVMQALPFPNTDPNVLEYAVTLTRNGTTSSPIFLNWNTGYAITAAPQRAVFTAVNPKQVPTDPYYFNYSYQQFIDMVNTALAAAYTALPDKGTTTQPPYMTFDSDTGLFSMFAQQTYFQNADPNNSGNLLIWFNTPLYTFFPSFHIKYGGFTPTVPEQNFAIVIKNNNNNTPSSPTGYYQMVQEYPTLFSWNSLQSISFRSNSIPVLQEAASGISAASGQSLQGSVSGNQIAFVTDFEPYNDAARAGVFRERIQYYPQAEYRLTDLIGTTPLSVIDLQLYWTDLSGDVYPIYIPPGDDFSVKILFRKKSFYQ